MRLGEGLLLLELLLKRGLENLLLVVSLSSGVEEASKLLADGDEGGRKLLTVLEAQFVPSRRKSARTLSRSLSWSKSKVTRTEVLIASLSKFAKGLPAAFVSAWARLLKEASLIFMAREVAATIAGAIVLNICKLKLINA